MYLLDWKVPRRLEEPRDQIYNHYINTTGEQHTTTQKDKMVKAIGCFVYNASYNLAGGKRELEVTLRPESFSNPLIYNCNRVKRKVSYRYTKLLVDWLCAEDLITLSLGSVSSFKKDSGGVVPAECQMSLVGLSEELVGLLEHVSSRQDQEILQSVLEIKGSGGELLAKRLGEPQKKLISLLNTYNQYAKASSISLDGKEYYIQCKKVFNDGSFQRGGRVYMTGAAVMNELMKRDMRGDIEIDGEPTQSLDFSHLHPSIIAVKEGVVFPDDYDPYQITLDGYDPECLRKIAKLGLLIIFNCDSPRSCYQALSWECGGKLPLAQWQSQGLVPKPMEYKKIVEALREHNAYASQWFFEGSGLDLQYIDSLIIDEIIVYWNERQVTILTLHDSVRIQEKYLAECREVMYTAYEKVLGTIDNCKIKLEG